MNNEHNIRRWPLAVVSMMVIGALAACTPNRAQTPAQPEGAVPTQLELSLGLKSDEWGRYTLTQLSIIKSLQESPDTSEKYARIAYVKKYLPLGLTF